MQQKEIVQRISFWLVLFIGGLLLSGVTAFPLLTELQWFHRLLLTEVLRRISFAIGLLPWIARVHEGLAAMHQSYPFLAYGTDWLAFAHMVIAIAFIGPCREPVRNKWVIDFGLIACAGIIPLALIAGAVRCIPFPWRLIDCSSGVFGCIPLLLCRRWISVLERDHAQ
ncbi:hypothetical protein [Silvibacterium sp.]|uniref:hypothetical protein n=1 Tax=Silvibacterium sp. TaxID=1964179 RepID=UPI0039E3FAED